jgi:uncharacterized protein
MQNLHPQKYGQLIHFKSLLAYFAIAFGLAWGILILWILFPQPLTAMFGKISGTHPLFILAVYSPAIAAFILVTRNAGVKGLRRFFSRLLLWRCSIGWYALLLFGIPLLFYGGAYLKGNLFQAPFPFSTWQAMLASLALRLAIGPVEEFGWRGYALPLLQQRFAPIWAGLMLGVIWGVWHLPAFYLSGTPQSAWSFAPFFIGSIAISVIITPMFNASGGSILLPVLFHFQLNNPIYPDAQPYDTIMFVLAAIVVVWINRKKMFSKIGVVTEVIPTTLDNRFPTRGDHIQAP